jgi:hypothetical protein
VSRVRENRTHGSMGGRWKRSGTTHGDGLSPQRETPGPWQPGLPIVAATAPAPYPTATPVPGPGQSLLLVVTGVASLAVAANTLG